jgi:hypothetical protein
VVEKTRRIPFGIAVQVEFLVEAENEPVLLLQRRDDSALVMRSPVYSMTRAPCGIKRVANPPCP